MPLRRKLCQNWKLYVITDSQAVGARPLVSVVQSAIAGGADVVQLRDKEASDEEMIAMAQSLLEITRPRQVPLIINDRVGVAKLSGADGVHLGQEDGALEEVRAVLGDEAIIGRSTHSQDQALKAQAEGFDYIGVGPVFQTPTKPAYAPVGLELVRFAAGNIKIPFVAIGGIDTENVSTVRNAGAKAIAVVRAVMGSDDPKETAKRFVELLSCSAGFSVPRFNVAHL